MAIEEVPTFCRVCESSCGLLAEREDDVILKLKPDKAHPVSKGFTCRKGLLTLDIHHDADRLNYPLKRTNSRKEAIGKFEQQDWDTAATEIAERLNYIVEQHGPNAVALYYGNPLVFDSLVQPAMYSLVRKIGTGRLFNSGSQDCTNKFAAGEAIYGTSTLHPIPDIDHTDYLLIIGENPKISHMSFLSISNPIGRLKRAAKRGAAIRYINPRRIESADETGDVTQIRPDTDLYFLAALLHEIDRLGRLDEDVIEAHGRNIEGLRQFIREYSPQAVETVVGIPAGEICSIADSFSAAGKASVHMSTGVNMGRQGTLCYWLVQMLSFVTGNLGRQGGNYYAAGVYPAAKSGRIGTDDPFFNSPFGPLRTIMGSLPGNLLADMIDTDTDPIRALLVVSGNPVLTVGGEKKLRSAFEKLDLLVASDIYRNATGEMADYLLPSADFLERSDINTCGIGLQMEPFVQFSDAVVPPRFERRDQWWILSCIEQALESEPASTEPQYDPFARIDKMLSHAGLSIEKLRVLPSRTAVLPKPDIESFYGRWLQTADRKVDCCPAIFSEPLSLAGTIYRELAEEPEGQLKLISLRNDYMHNSWFHNLEPLKKGEHLTNPLYLNPGDARKLGLAAGSRARMSNRWGTIEAVVGIDDRLREGVVAMAHGWGNGMTPGMKIAHRYPGVNVNQLLPCGPGSYEVISNQAHMTGIPVNVEKVQDNGP